MDLFYDVVVTDDKYSIAVYNDDTRNAANRLGYIKLVMY